MREFLLRNSFGEQKPLQYGDVFLWLPSGLGYGYATEYMESNDFFLPTYTEDAHTPINATLVFFPPNAYAKYQALFNWILGSQDLELAYKPINNWYYQRISIDTVEKSELTRAGTLEVPIQIMPLSPIYTPYDLNLDIEGQTAHSNKKYDYAYPYVYSNSGVAGKLNFTISAQCDCDFQLELDGAISAPSVTVTRNDTGVTIGKIDLTATSAQVGETIVYNTVAGRAGAVKIDADNTESDLTPYLGLTTGLPTFFRLPANVPCSLQVSATSLLGLRARMKVYRYYRTV